MSDFLDSILNTYREVEVAKRSQPKVVQMAEHQQTPFTQNVQAPAQPLSSDTQKNFNVVGVPMNKAVLYVTAGLLGLVVVGSLVKR